MNKNKENKKKDNG